MQKCRSTAQVAEDEQRFFDGMIFVCREENVVQPKAKPVDEGADGPDRVEEQEKEHPRRLPGFGYLIDELFQFVIRRVLDTSSPRLGQP